MGLLVTLSQAIAAQLNEQLSEDTIEKLAGKEMDPEEFKKFVRQELAKESVTAQLEATAEPEPFTPEHD